MPTYVYRREDGSKFKIQQRITEDPLETCPETGQPVERIITGSAGLIFKGEGFYVNDYGNSGRRSGSSANGTSPDEGASGNPASDSGSSSSESSSGSAETSSGGSSSNAA